MPIYEYECTKCGERFELRRSINDSDEEIVCPRCGKESPTKLFSTFGMASSSGNSCAPSAPGGST